MSAQHRLHNGSFAVAAVTRDRLWPDENDLAHRDERNLLVLLVAGDALGARIERRFAVDQELIVMVALRQGHFGAPATVCLTFHRCGVRMPIVEIANQRHALRGIDHAEEADGFDGFFS